MTRLFEEAVARIEVLSEKEQDRAASVLIALTSEQLPYELTADQIAGIKEAMRMADAGVFADDAHVQSFFGCSL